VIVTRFAPSPTGLLHVGNARTALVAWLFARHAGGRFLLRVDDTDTERSEEAYIAAIRRDLAWLGLDWDAEVRQSDRMPAYDAAIDRLKAAGRLYPCYETPDELALKRRSQLQQNRPPIYDRAALAMTEADRARFEAEGRRPHWRFLLAHAPIAWEDLVRGPVRFEGRDLSDPVIVREDGRPLYHICSVVDDIALAITHVVRGEDHVANTAAHIQMTEALGAAPPAFVHLPLLADAAGKGLSKRLGSLTLESLREAAGLEPMAVVSLLARLGTADPVVPQTRLAPLVECFDIERFGRATPKFDPDELKRLNPQVLHHLDFADIAGRLPGLGLPDVDPGFWEAVRPNLTVFADLADWWRVAKGPVAPQIADADFAAAAADALPSEPWDEETWSRWVETVKARTGLKGKALFRPLRLALTGRESGPELKVLLPLIGRDRARARLLGESA
jgi:glutamyl-tRNA synthetase